MAPIKLRLACSSPERAKRGSPNRSLLTGPVLSPSNHGLLKPPVVEGGFSDLDGGPSGPTDCKRAYMPCSAWCEGMRGNMRATMSAASVTWRLLRGARRRAARNGGPAQPGNRSSSLAAASRSPSVPPAFSRHARSWRWTRHSRNLAARRARASPRRRFPTAWATNSPTSRNIASTGLVLRPLHPIPTTRWSASPPGTAPTSIASLTANGENYDMTALTAAHKTLPLPSYVRVTNIGQRRVDRGPRQRPRPVLQ